MFCSTFMPFYNRGRYYSLQKCIRKPATKSSPFVLFQSEVLATAHQEVVPHHSSHSRRKFEESAIRERFPSRPQE